MIWSSYIVLAAYLVRLNSEAAKRSAVSRAYYGVFNAVRNRLEAGGMEIENHRVHERVWRTCRVAEHASSATESKWRMIGELGAGLRGLRNQADYADVVPALDKRAERAVGVAERILILLDELEVN
jgi:uncharacterized protein (UPF0332 family)